MGKKKRGGARARQRRIVRRAADSLPPLPPKPQSPHTQGTRHSPEPPAVPPRRSSPATPPRPPLRSSSLWSPTKDAMDKKQYLGERSGIIENVKKFLDQTSAERNKMAKEKIELYQRKSTPGKGYEKKEMIPPHVTYCYMCNYYKAKIHFC